VQNYASINSSASGINCPKRLSDKMYFKLMNSLNEQQHAYVMNLLNSMKSKEQFFHFVRGGSGVGKSFLIKAVYQTVLRLLQPKSTNVYRPGNKGDDDDDDAEDDEDDERGADVPVAMAMSILRTLDTSPETILPQINKLNKKKRIEELRYCFD